MYRVLYRKWRPQTFLDVSGQPHITETLMNEVKDNRLAHAYLFTGSRGTGKTSCAKILSKAINCLHPVNGNPCNECEICKGIDNGSILDIVEIDAASNRGIDDIRALREESAFTPAQTKYRVYIIDEVHMLTIEAFNALLKTLEEPPAHIVFILATTEVQKLPSTILSRCQRFDFKRISVDAIVSRLKYVAKNENVTISDDAAMLIARIADGGMRDALSIFDRALSISENVDVKVVSDAAGIMSRDYLFQLSDAFKRKDTSKALAIIDELHNSSCDTERLCVELTNHFRSLLIIKSVDKPENILVCTNEELADFKNLADNFTVEEILNIMNILSSAIASIKVTQNRRIETEMAIIKICTPEISTDVSALFARVAELEAKIKDLSTGRIVASPMQTTNESNAQKAEKPTVDLSALDFEDDSDEYEDADDDFFMPSPPPVQEDLLPDFDSIPSFDSEPPIPETTNEPVFDEPPIFDAEPQFGAEPAFDDLPVFDDSPIFDAEPVFDAPPQFDEMPAGQDNNAPVFNEQPTPSINNNDMRKMWLNCIIDVEKNCPPIIGHLVGTSAQIIGDVLTISEYNQVLPMIFPIVKDAITNSVKKITGQNLSVRLGNL